jgi:hypothetical protein
MVAAHMFNNYVLSFVTDEVIFRSLPPAAPIAYESILGTGFEMLSFEDQFNCGLEVLFAGFKVLK